MLTVNNTPSGFPILLGSAFVLAVFQCHAAFAQPALLAGGALAPTAAVPNLGPLMLTPIQRKNLEFLRNSTGRSGVSGTAIDELLDPRAGLPETLTISGVVIRSGGRSTVWINNDALYGKAGDSALRTLAGQAGVLNPATTEMRIRAKPGTVVDVPTKQLTDLLPDGAIRIIPPKARAGAVTKG